MLETIRELNIDLIVTGITLLSTVYLLVKQFPRLKMSKIICSYYVDESSIDENGNPAIELLPYIMIVNKSQNPTSIYSIELKFKKNFKLFTRIIDYKKAVEIIFYNDEGECIKFTNIINGRSLIELGPYQALIGHIDNWIHANEDELGEAQIVIRTTRGKIARRVKSFRKIDANKIREEEY